MSESDELVEELRAAQHRRARAVAIGGLLLALFGAVLVLWIDRSNERSVAERRARAHEESAAAFRRQEARRAENEERSRKLASQASVLVSKRAWRLAREALVEAKQLAPLDGLGEELLRASTLMVGVGYACAGRLPDLLTLEPEIPSRAPLLIRGDDRVFAERLLQVVPVLRSLKAHDGAKHDYLSAREKNRSDFEANCRSKLELYDRTVSGRVRIVSWIDTAAHPKAPPNAYLARMPSGSPFILLRLGDQAFVTAGVAEVVIAKSVDSGRLFGEDFAPFPVYIEWTPEGLASVRECQREQAAAEATETEAVNADRLDRESYERLQQGLPALCVLSTEDRGSAAGRTPAEGDAAVPDSRAGSEGGKDNAVTSD